MKWFAFLLIITASSCKKNIPFSKNYTIEKNNCVEENFHGKKAKLCFEELLEDSRCPVGKVCIWQGVAKARFALELENQIHHFDLSTSTILPNYRNDTTVYGFTIKLQDITPHPGEMPNTIKAALLVTRQ